MIAINKSIMMGEFLSDLAPGVGLFVLLLGSFGGIAAIVYVIVTQFPKDIYGEDDDENVEDDSSTIKTFNKNEFSTEDDFSNEDLF